MTNLIKKIKFSYLREAKMCPFSLNGHNATAVDYTIYAIFV